jgi:carboxyl-terminal processing protease
MAELRNERVWSFGLWLEEVRPGRLFVRALFEGGPAARAGLRTGDRILRVDGVDVALSSAIVDAGYDPNFRGPRRFTLLALPGQAVRIEAERRRGSPLSFDLAARSMNGVDAARNSLRVLERAGCRIGTLHIWYCSAGVEAVLKDALANALRDCEVLVVDLRGRGGYSHVGKRILDRLRQDGRPAVFLIDRRTRSAKEVLAYRIRRHDLGPLVGARTEGAVLGAGFFPLPDGTVLELPIMEVTVDGLRLEGVGVAPDHRVKTSLPFTAGRDAIFEMGCAVAVQERNRRLGWTLVGAESADKRDMIERKGNRQEAREKGSPRRLEIDLIRFEATRLPTGLYRHNPVKWIFEISRHRQRAASRGS